MKVNTIRNLVMGTLLAGGTALMSSCADYNTGKGLHDYMDSKGATQAQLDSVLKTTYSRNPISTAIRRQSTLDSMAFRNVFNYTHKANDSAAVAEFNKIASKGLLSNITAYGYPNPYSASKEQVINTLINEGMSIQFIDSTKEYFKSLEANKLIYNDYDLQNFQHYMDTKLYRIFFEKHKLLVENDNGTNIRHAFFVTWSNTSPEKIKDSAYQNNGLGHKMINMCTEE